MADLVCHATQGTFLPNVFLRGFQKEMTKYSG
jgi:hypothetical protein